MFKKAQWVISKEWSPHYLSEVERWSDKISAELRCRQLNEINEDYRFKYVVTKEKKKI